MILGTPNGKVSVSDVAKPRGSMVSVFSGSTDTLTGRAVTREDAMGVAAWYGGVSLIAETAGTLPVRVRDRRNRSQIVESADVAVRLRDAPNPEMPAATFWSTMFHALVGTHNAFALKLPASDGPRFAPELYPVPPEHVSVYRDDRGVVRFDVVSDDGSMRVEGLTRAHVLHARGPSIGSSLRGSSPIALHAATLGIALSATEHQARYFRQGATPKGILSIEDSLTTEQAITLRDQWHATYGGVENSHRIAVLDRGASFQQVASSNADAQLVELLGLTATDIARILRIPAPMLSAGAKGSTITYQNAAHNDLHFLKFTLRAPLKYMEGALNLDADLFGATSPWVPEFETDDVVKPDTEARSRIYAQDIAAGWRLPDEVREAEGLPERELPPTGRAGDSAPPPVGEPPVDDATEGEDE